jgi:hypothetical protein
VHGITDELIASIEVMPKNPKEITYTFQEIPLQYDWNEYQQWKTGDVPIREKLLKISGYLRQKKETYYHQVTQHYPEVKYAGHLVKKEKFNKDFIIYEKFRLSHKFLNGGTAVSYTEFLEAYYCLREILSEKFFVEFDRLCELNDSHNIIERKDTIYKICVDLCAISHNKSEVRFSEIKKYNIGKNREKINPDQLLVLAFIKNIVNSLGKKAFHNEKIYSVKTELIALVAEQDVRRLTRFANNPEEYHRPCNFFAESM